VAEEAADLVVAVVEVVEVVTVVVAAGLVVPLKLHQQCLRK